MIKRIAIGGTAFLVAVAVTASTLMQQEPGPAQAPAQQPSLFEWFDTLDDLAVRDAQFVRFETRYEWEGRIQPGETLYGFLLAGSDEQFTVLTLDLDTLSFPSSTPERKASFVAADFATWARAELKPHRKDPFRHIAWEGPLSFRGFLFVAARACDARGLKEESAEFLRRSKAELDEYRRETSDYRAQLADDLATHAVWEAIGRFGDPRVSRKELLARLEHIVRDFPGGPRKDVARETITVLQKMVAEDEAHPTPSEPLDQLPIDRHVAELIFRLRDQPGFQNSVPGYPNVLETPETTPANQLLRLGFAAVPQLLETLKDDRFTRAMQMVRFTGFSQPLQVKDAAYTILSEIAVRSFWPEGGANSLAEQDSKIEQNARAWWKEVQEKGELRVLIEGVERGDYQGGRQAKFLAEKYPASAVSAIKVGLTRATKETVREAFLAALMPIRLDEAVDLARHHMLNGATLPERLAGARVLSTSDAPAAVRAMISEWRSMGREYESGAYQLISFLAGSGRSEAVEALRFKLPSKDPETRREVVQAFVFKIPFVMPEGYPEQGLQPQDDQEKEAYRNAVEALLAGELTDAVDASGAIFNYRGESFDQPRICDLAASEMAMLWPSRYRYRVTSSRIAMDTMRIESLNTWRGLKGLSPLPLPSRPLSKAPTERQRFLVSQAIARRGTEQKQAIKELLPHAPSALPLVLQEIARREGAKLDATDLPPLAATLASAVRQVDVRGPGGAFTARVKALEGTALTTDWVMKFVREIQGRWPKGAHTVEFDASRDEDGRGFAVSVLFSNKVPGQNPDAWNHWISVRANGKSLWDSGVSSTPGPSMDERLIAEFASAVHEALSSPPPTTISIRFSLSRPIPPQW